MTKRILTAIVLLIVLAVPTSCGVPAAVNEANSKAEAKAKAEEKKADDKEKTVDLKVERHGQFRIVDADIPAFETPRIVVWCASDGTTLWSVAEIVKTGTHDYDGTAAAGGYTVTPGGCNDGVPRL